MDAVRATALALHRLIVEQKKSPVSLYPVDLLKALRSGTFPNSVDPSESISFDKNGDVYNGYRITNLKMVNITFDINSCSVPERHKF